MNILEQIIADKRVEIARKKERGSWPELEARAVAVPVRPDFVSALRAVPMGLIAEVKRRSPSAGLIRDPFDPVLIARSYERHNAQAISCLMDHKYFGGGEDDFLSVRQTISLPMLYKEFVVDPWQILHAKAMGASAVLLIAAALTDVELKSFIGRIRDLAMQPLVEVHDHDEMQRAIDVGSDCIGINNRNLKTFVTTLDVTFELAAMAPGNCTLVSESGIKTPEDVIQVQRAGAHAVLVGESLLREPDPGLAATDLMRMI